MTRDDDALMQALHDPENQPSQWGTVPVAMAEASRRERIATAALQGMLAWPGRLSVDPESVARVAMVYADALIAEPDKGRGG